MYENLTKSDYLVINNNQSQVALVIGWYPLNTMITRLKKDGLLDKVEVIGNLFNPITGVELLVRNLLHNPQITTVVLFKGTHQDNEINSVDSFNQAITDYEHFCRVCISRPLLSFDDFSELAKINYHTCNTFEALKSVLVSIKPSAIKRKKVTKPKALPVVKNNYPGRLISQYVQDISIPRAHIQACHRVTSNGRMLAGKKNLLELLNLNICVTDAPRILGELLSICSPSECDYINGFIHPVRESINYNYGHRLRFYDGDLVMTAIDKLKRKPESLAVLLPIFHNADLTNGNSPCLITIWLRVHNNTLDMFATFRSNDIWKAWKYNALGLRGLQIHIANESGFMVGLLHTNSLSAHVYIEDLDQIPPHQQLKTDYTSAVGNFHITVNGNRIVVNQYDNAGNEIKVYSQHNPRNLLRDIANINPTIEPDHIGYLGIELQKAKHCMDNQLSYRQDFT